MGKPNESESETSEQLKKREKWNRYMRTYRAKHPDRVRKARRRQYINRKTKAMKAVSDAKCERCGCDEIDFLEFNHKNGGGCQEHRITDCKPMMDRILTKNRDTDDLEILCRICNALEFLERKNKKSAKGFKIKWK